VTGDGKGGRELVLMSCPGDYPNGALTFPCDPVALPDGPIKLRVTVDKASQQFWFDAGSGWETLGPSLDASVISDEGGKGEHGSFTGAFVGMVAFDVTGRAQEARFPYFNYVPS
jgi:xylan 1,4-beta-xylosidase